MDNFNHTQEKDKTANLEADKNKNAIKDKKINTEQDKNQKKSINVGKDSIEFDTKVVQDKDKAGEVKKVDSNALAMVSTWHSSVRVLEYVC